MAAGQTKKPRTTPEYIEWAKATLGVDFGHADSARLYDLNVAAAVSAVQDHPFWRDLPTLLERVAAQYGDSHKADLFPTGSVPQLLKKASIEFRVGDAA
jgi:hypothetical protein